MVQGPRYLNYDLHILYDHVRVHSLSRVVLLFQDGEALEGSLLADLTEILTYDELLITKMSRS